MTPELLRRIMDQSRKGAGQLATIPGEIRDIPLDVQGCLQKVNISVLVQGVHATDWKLSNEQMTCFVLGCIGWLAVLIC